MTNESGTFFQVPSVPTVTADELSKTPETSNDTPKQEDREEIKVTKIEALTDEKPVDDVEAVSTQTEREVETIRNKDKNDGKAVQIDEGTQEKEQALNTLEKDQVVDSSRRIISNDAQEEESLRKINACLKPFVFDTFGFLAPETVELLNRVQRVMNSRMYVSGRVDIFDMVDIDLFTVVALNMMVLKLCYTCEFDPMFYNYLRPLTSLDVGLYALACEEDVRCLSTLVRSFKLIEVIDDAMRQLSFDETELDVEAGFADVLGSGVDNVGPTQEPILAEISTQEPVVTEVSTQEPIMAEISTEAPIVEEVGTQEFSVEDVVIEDYVSSEEDGKDVEHDNDKEDESAPTDGQFSYDDKGIHTAYETKYDVQSSEDAGTDDDDDDDDGVDIDFLVDEENEIVEPDVDVHLFGEDVDVINTDGFDSDPGNDEERNHKKRSPKEAKDIVYLHSIESRRNLKRYKNDNIRIRARCEGKVPVFTISQGTGPTGPYSGMEAGPSGSNGPTTRSKKRRIQ
nr:shikimate O-hydroxycinnamoyltransferase [Tanacetum cinerariifolium]